MSVRILFVDIDGVFHNADTPRLDAAGEVIPAEGDTLFAWAPILAQLLEPHPDVRIVIHSSWRYEYPLKKIRQHFPEFLRQRIIAVTQEDLGRAESIEDFVDGHGIRDFLVLDDYLPEFTRSEDIWIHYDRLVLLNGSLGISEECAQNSIRDWLEGRR